MVATSTIRAGVLDVGVERHGVRGGPPVVLLHGFPYDPRAFDAVVGPLASLGADVVVPYLRGYGPTRFASERTPRSGEQAALAHDLLALLEALLLKPAVLAGYDWGGRAACLVAMLWPDRAAGLVTVGGYNVQDIAGSGAPAPIADEHALWYQYYLHSERGRAGLAADRDGFARLLWSLWSPTWEWDEATFAATAPSLHNPDFVDVVVHSYRHRFGLVAGDPAYRQTQNAIARLPSIDVPTVVLNAADDGISAPDPRSTHERHFGSLVDVVDVAAGHNLPQEAPGAVVDAVRTLLGT